MPDDSSLHFQEWLQARSVIATADTNLDALRKLGISLVTGLLTVDAFLLPGYISGASALPIPLKFGVLLATLLLLGAIAVIDRNYQVLQQAAASRAKVLEKELNLELTEVIASRYAEMYVSLVFHLIYVVIGGALLVLGYFVLDPSGWFLALLVTWIAWSTLTLLISATLDREGGVDWSIDSTDVTRGEIVYLTATNLFSESRRPLFPSLPTHLYERYLARYERKRRFTLQETDVFWELRSESAKTESKSLREGRVVGKFSLGPQQTFVWAIDTSGVNAPVVLSVLAREPFNLPDGTTVWIPWPEPLSRKIRVRPRSDKDDGQGKPSPPEAGINPSRV